MSSLTTNQLSSVSSARIFFFISTNNHPFLWYYLQLSSPQHFTLSALISNRRPTTVFNLSVWPISIAFITSQNRDGRRIPPMCPVLRRQWRRITQSSGPTFISCYLITTGRYSQISLYRRVSSDSYIHLHVLSQALWRSLSPPTSGSSPFSFAWNLFGTNAMRPWPTLKSCLNWEQNSA